ncbi:hypothetical protein ACFV8T_01620 [Streptomyces sp. NPDC059832]|uniref:hypothetical protein n=1 Tax=Streptomyces sp. NPDC059832 TaxID=3346966 RepID=UPI0036597892
MDKGALPPEYQRILAVVQQAAGPVMTRQVGEALGLDHVADLLRRHLKATRSRRRALPPGKIALIVLAVLRHDRRLADMAGGNNISATSVRRRRDEIIGLLAAKASWPGCCVHPKSARSE